MTPPRSPARPIWTIILTTWASLTLFAILHDQITARLCPEYFTVAHPDNGLPGLFHNPSPTILGFAWGIAASLGPGMLAGILLALSAQAGPHPPKPPRTVFLATLPLFALMGIIASFAGYLGHHLEPLPDLRAFTAVLHAHRATYLTGTLGALLLAALLLFSRRPSRPA